MERRKWNYSPICPAVNCDFSDMGNFFIMSASYDLFFISEIKMRFFFGKHILAKILITPVKCHCSIFCGTISSLNVDVYADIVSTR